MVGVDKANGGGSASTDLRGRQLLLLKPSEVLRWKCLRQ